MNICKIKFNEYSSNKTEYISLKQTWRNIIYLNWMNIYKIKFNEYLSNKTEYISLKQTWAENFRMVDIRIKA